MKRSLKKAMSSQKGKLLLLAPALLMLLVVFVYPIGKLLINSFFDPGFTFKHYLHIFRHPVYLKVILTTFKISLTVTGVCLVIGYLVSYYLARRAKGWIRDAALSIILASFLLSFLVKVFVWMIILQKTGLVNRILLQVGVISHPLNLLYNYFGVIIGMSQILLPYMILPLYSVMVSIDEDLIKAAKNLGATPLKAFWKIFFPLSLPGLGAGSMQVFILAIGYFIIPQLLGGESETMISQLISLHVNRFGNWGFASALSTFLLAIILILVWVYNRYVGLEQGWGELSA